MSFKGVCNLTESRPSERQGQLLVESEATYVRTITKPELIPDPLWQSWEY